MLAHRLTKEMPSAVCVRQLYLLTRSYDCSSAKDQIKSCRSWALVQGREVGTVAAVPVRKKKLDLPSCVRWWYWWPHNGTYPTNCVLTRSDTITWLYSIPSLPSSEQYCILHHRSSMWYPCSPLHLLYNVLTSKRRIKDTSWLHHMNQMSVPVL